MKLATVLFATMCLNIIGMEYKIQNSWSVHPDFYFILTYEEQNGTYRLTNGSEVPEQEARTIEVPASFAQQLDQIVQEENMTGYKRDYESEYEIHDGTSWTIHIRFKDNKQSVYSSGYEAYPDDDGLKRVKQLCLDTWAELNKPKNESQNP